MTGQPAQACLPWGAECANDLGVDENGLADEI
jgi:hypothetical protein